jgi:hypothetical protein
MSEHNIGITLSTSRKTKPNWLAALVLILSQALTNGLAEAAEEYRTVSVADPYLEMRTGPGRGYPKFHVVDRGETVDILMRKTDWFKVRAPNGKEGWVDRGQMELTLQPSGEQIEFAQADLEDFTNARWEMGILAGDFGGANIISLYGGYSLNPNVSIEVWGSQILGNFSNGSPFFTMGTGVIHTEPKSTIIQGEDRTDQVAHVGAGVRFYATRRFSLRAEYKSYVVFTSRDENEEVEEWKVGFAFFF